MKKRVAILMCCKNSKKFIKEQLISIKDQSYKNYKLFISIDRSVDGTTKLIEDITKELNINCKIFKGPNKGFSENYKFLTKKVNNFDYYAWCDHDDIWLKNKIKNGLNKINKDPITASMYVSNYKLINENGTIIGIPEYKNICSFQNSLLENISPGHTYLFNNCAKNLFNMCDGKLISHDWSMLQIVLGVGGQVYVDSIYGSFYRQHKNNTIGYRRGKLEKLYKFYRCLQNEVIHYNNSNYFFLKKISSKLTHQNKKALEILINFKKNNLFKRIFLFKKNKFKRQVFYENFGYYILLFLNKI